MVSDHQENPQANKLEDYVNLGRSSEIIFESGKLASKPDPTLQLSDLEYKPVHSFIEGFAARTPDAIAISQQNRQWTYRELREQALQTVVALQNLGVKQGSTVAITGPRCFELIAAIIAVWMNGQVILLLDPALPESRKEMMLEESAAEFLLFVGHSLETFSYCPRLDLKRLQPYSHQELVQLPTVQSVAPAYIFFTSGTTGRPKGILGTHKGLAHFLDWQKNTFKVSSNDRIAQLTSISFDVVLRDIFLPLTSGATICLPPETLDLSNPWKWFSQAEITRLHTVPSLSSIWLENAPTEKACETLKTVFLAGEPLTDELVRRWRSITSTSLEIINLYGPTETTLAKCWYKIPDLPISGVQSIGYPLPGSQILIINEQKELCQNGETGEIAIRTPFDILPPINRGILQSHP